ncbi:hypothetical protein CISIN_1g036445mg [Citrus sinensis]|uniref:non-specific serine/threonine protein kinase n=1 Tax=Citrus sinensis TaxID=2711 RepID=A0A067D2R7_CITSI|nr:hypothetical protein CISIN_1g036445mg [Citrus sinensis]
MILLITIIFPIAAFVAFLAHGTLFLLRRKNKRAELTSGEIKSQDRDAFSIWSCDGRIAFEEIIRATEDFDIKYCIGTGCYGSVYKARLPSGRICNNILLNSGFEAFFGNFGVARLLNSDSSNRNLIAGTYRYIAPEKCDVYSFEILSLFSSTPDPHITLTYILDQRLSPPKKQKIVQDIALASIVGLACLQSKPKSVPTMQRVSQEFIEQNESSSSIKTRCNSII